jgi:hypothetical protein
LSLLDTEIGGPRVKVLLSVLSVLLLAGCGGVTKMVDPYYGEFSCGTPETGFKCKDLGTVYEALDAGETSSPEQSFNGAPPPGEPPDFFDQNQDSFWSAYGLPFLKGSLVGAGIGAAAGAFIDSGDSRLESALTGAAIAGGAGGVVGVLVSHYQRQGGSLGRQERRRLEDKASLFAKCVKEAQGREKEEGTETAVASMHQCSSILADLPGLVPYQSAALAARLSIQRERDLKRTFTGVAEGAMPLRIPPRIVEVLVAPYVDSNDVLVRGHDIYIAVDEGRWILPHPGEKNSARILKPLQEVKE